MRDIRIELTKHPKKKPQDETDLGFGRIFTDHMFIMNYDEGMGWHDARIVPFAPLELSPAAMTLHYGQSVFEGLKAYHGVDGKIRMFRPDKNFARLNVSNDRMCIPQIDEKFAEKCLEKLVDIEKEWIPKADGTSLYIRPFIIGVDPYVGVQPSTSLLFMIILSPVGAYYKTGLDPVKIYVENKYVRAVRGGTGFAKTAANYASSLKSQSEAISQNYSQVLWLDGIERKYIEEVGTMNVFFVIDGEVVTPSIDSGSILSGITRMSCIELLKSWGYKVVERPISIDELYEAYQSGHLNESFGSGTAAVISPIGTLKWDDKIMLINNGEIGNISQKLFDNLTGIQFGKLEDSMGWNVVVE